MQDIWSEQECITLFDCSSVRSVGRGGTQHDIDSSATNKIWTFPPAVLALRIFNDNIQLARRAYRLYGIMRARFS